MKKITLLLTALLVSFGLAAQERQTVWPKGKMPDKQDHQIAAMTNETSQKDFKADKHRVAYLEWFDAPAKDIHNGGCMILISGGSYQVCCDVDLIKMWNERFTAIGCQCVNFVYRTPRPKNLEIWRTAWQDGQRAVRLVRSEAKKRGFDPEKIGTMSMSAGSHLATLLATSALTPAYNAVDMLDKVPCHINWAITGAIAYGVDDGLLGANERGGQAIDAKITKCFKFDDKTAPMCMFHGGIDIYSPAASTLVYRELR
jgi:acetyl esterase/lipase